MTTLPTYLEEQTEEAIRQRMLDRLPRDLDQAEGSYIWDALAPASIELARAAVWAQEVLRRGFASTTYGAYLDLRAEEHGLRRRSAARAQGAVVFQGKPGTEVPAGTRVATPADRMTGASAVLFETTELVGLDAAGSGRAAVRAVEAGAQGNVAASAISLVVTPVTGLISVTNPSSCTGGLYTEDDALLLERYLQKVRSPSTGGNKADYVNWALEVPGVGGVSVIPVRDGPGTVSVAIMNSDHEPADQALVDAVQQAIAPAWKTVIPVAEMTLGGHGVTIAESASQSPSVWIAMAHNAAGEGTVTKQLHPLLQQAGVWQVRIPVKVEAASQTTALLRYGIWNASREQWCNTTPAGTEQAMATYTASQLSETWQTLIHELYWDGLDQLELRLVRLQSDTVTTVDVDACTAISTFSTSLGEGKAPIGARVTVESAKAVPIDVSVSLTLMDNQSGAAVQAAVRENVQTYIKSLAFAAARDVRVVRIGQAILDTAGVQDYEQLLVNNDERNVSIGEQEIAVLGEVTFT